MGLQYEKEMYMVTRENCGARRRKGGIRDSAVFKGRKDWVVVGEKVGLDGGKWNLGGGTVELEGGQMGLKDRKIELYEEKVKQGIRRLDIREEKVRFKR